MYSPYVFALGQLIGEMPYSIVCAFAYWVLMVRPSSQKRYITLTYLVCQVWPMGFGQGASGTAGNGFQFLMVLFMEFVGGTFSASLPACADEVGS